MPLKIPPALGMALSWLRSAIGWNRPRLARGAAITVSHLRRLENGDRTLSRDYLDWLLAFLPRRYPPEAVDVLVFAHHLIFPELVEAASPVSLTPEEQQKIDCAVLAAGWIAIEELRAEAIRAKKAEKAEAARRQAEELWPQLVPGTRQERRERVTRLPELRTWAVALRVCEASVRAAANSAQQALELAELALFIAGRVPEAASFRLRLEGYCWAHIANSRRIAEDFDGADEAFIRVWDLWRAGAESDSELLPEWRLLDLEASLRREQHQFPQALDLLDRARASAGEDPIATGRILLNKENVFNQMGDIQGALATLVEAVPFVEASQDPHLLLRLRFNLTDDLCHLERYAEAARLLPQVRDLAIDQANDLDLIRVVWLDARIAAGQGRLEDAVAGLTQVREDFAARELPYDAALASLDLAVLWLRAGRAAEVRELAVAMGWIFRAKGIHREALAALRLFCEAAKGERATVELARRVISDIERARRSAPPAK